MQRKIDEWCSRIKDVEREYRIAALAMERLIKDSSQDPSIVQELSYRDLRQAVDSLEGTYIIRLFAEFETGLRNYWLGAKKKKSTPQAEVLINRIGTLRDIPANLVSPVHDVREYRNALIHEREAVTMTISLPNARAHLCKYFARLPSTWS